VDFEGALAGDPLMDVAKALYYERTHKQKVAALLAGYGPMERQRWMETLDLYHLYYAVELWCWVVQHGDGEALAKAEPEIERYST
jgi:aminoglycoside phosphotransferase (APT) family kinase protein